MRSCPLPLPQAASPAPRQDLAYGLYRLPISVTLEIQVRDPVLGICMGCVNIQTPFGPSLTHLRRPQPQVAYTAATPDTLDLTDSTGSRRRHRQLLAVSDLEPVYSALQELRDLPLAALSAARKAQRPVPLPRQYLRSAVQAQLEMEASFAQDHLVTLAALMDVAQDMGLRPSDGANGDMHPRRFLQAGGVQGNGSECGAPDGVVAWTSDQVDPTQSKRLGR